MPVRRFVQRLKRLKDQLLKERHRFIADPGLLQRKINSLIRTHKAAQTHVNELQQKQQLEQSEENQIRSFLTAQQELQIIMHTLSEIRELPRQRPSRN